MQKQGKEASTGSEPGGGKGKGKKKYDEGEADREFKRNRPSMPRAQGTTFDSDTKDKHARHQDHNGLATLRKSPRGNETPQSTSMTLQLTSNKSSEESAGDDPFAYR